MTKNKKNKKKIKKNYRADMAEDDAAYGLSTLSQHISTFFSKVIQSSLKFSRSSRNEKSSLTLLTKHSFNA